MFGERKLLQHDDRLHDMVVDFEAFLGGQGAPGDGKVVDLAEIELEYRHVELESVFFVLGRDCLLFAVDDVVVPVAEQVFHYRQVRRRRSVLAFLFFLGNAEPVIEGPGPLGMGDFLDPVDFFRGHEFTADVAFGDKGKVIVQLGQAFIQFGAELLRIPFAIGRGLKVFDLSFAFNHFETGADFMDAVIDGFKLSRLVDHVFRRRHLAAIVKQGGDGQFVPIVLAEVEIG